MASFQLLRPRECAKALGVSMTTLWRWTKTPDFPVAYRLGPNSIGFSEEEILAWLAKRLIAEDKALVKQRAKRRRL